MTAPGAAAGYLGVDLGTTSIKAGIFDGHGQQLGVASVEYSLASSCPGWVECEPRTYWDGLTRTVRAAHEEAATSSGGRLDVRGLALSCQGETLLCLDAAGSPDGPAIVWLDNRAVEEAVELEERLGAVNVYDHTGQVQVDATWPACKLLWLRRRDPGRFRRASKFVLLEDWILSQLCGELIGEESLYGSTLLLDIHRRAWWSEALEAVQVCEDKLVTLVPPGTLVGGLRSSAAEALGLPIGLPVVSGGLDQVLAATAGGNIRSGILTELTGTTVAMATCFPSFPESSASRLPIYLHVVSDQYCALPYAQTGGMMLRWLRDSLFAVEGFVSYDQLVAEVSGVAAGSDGVLVLPHLAGADFPEFDHSARAAVVGLTLVHRRAHVTRATLEAVGYVLRAAIEALRGAGVPVSEVRSLGPTADVPLWRQIKADISGLPVSRMRCSEASLLGAAMLVAVATGGYKDVHETVANMSSLLQPTLPRAELFDTYSDRYRAYRLLFDQLSPLFRASSPGSGAAGTV